MQTKPRPLYTSLAPLISAWGHLYRSLGVAAHDQFNHEFVEVSREEPILNTRTLMDYAKPADKDRTIISQTRAIVIQIDAIMLELQQHRDRLHAEVLRLEASLPSAALTE